MSELAVCETSGVFHLFDDFTNATGWLRQLHGFARKFEAYMPELNSIPLSSTDLQTAGTYITPAVRTTDSQSRFKSMLLRTDLSFFLIGDAFSIQYTHSHMLTLFYLRPSTGVN